MQQFEETSDCFEKPHKRLCLPLTYRLPKMLSESLVNFMRFLIFTRQWNKSLHWHATTLPRWTVTEATFSALGAFIRYRPEVDILPGKTWKCSMRSAFYWFAEFCHSQRLSHFAASFIVTRAEGSIAKSCKNKCLYNTKKCKIKSNTGYLLVAALPTEAGLTATFESIHLRCHRLHALTVRFRFKDGLLIV